MRIDARAGDRPDHGLRDGAVKVAAKVGRAIELNEDIANDVLPDRKAAMRRNSFGVEQESHARAPLEHVPEKWPRLSDENMLQFIELARIVFDQVIPPDRNTR